MQRLLPFLALLLLAHPGLAQRSNILQKEFNWSFDVSSGEQVDFLDKYGELIFETTSGSTLKVRAVLETWGASEAIAERMQQAVTVRQSGTEGLLTFATEIDERKLIQHQHAGFIVRYRVEIPKNVRLRVHQSYGKMELGDFSGELDAEIRYGTLRVGKLSGCFNDLRVAYSGGRIESITTGQVALSYTSGLFEIGSVQDLRLNVRYSKLRIDQADRLEMDAAYSKLYLGNIARLMGSAAYSEFSVEAVTKELRMSVRYLDDFRLEQLAETFERVNLEASYSDFRIGLPRNLRATFDFTMKYGGITGLPESGITYSHRERQDTRYIHMRGTLNQGDSRLLFADMRYCDLDFFSY